MANLMILKKVKPSAHYVSVSCPASSNNGNVFVLGANTAGVYAVTAPNAVTDEGMVILADEGLSYEAQLTADEKVFSTGEIVRCLQMELNDVIDIAVSNVTATAALAVGKVVVPKAGVSKMECLAALAGTEVLAFIIESLYTKAGVAMVSLRCIRTQK
jgi:hypothetical protein